MENDLFNSKAIKIALIIFGTIALLSVVFFVLFNIILNNYSQKGLEFMFKEIKRDTINLFIITIFIVVSCIYFMLCTIKYKFLIIFLCSMVIVLANSVLAPFLGSSDNKYFYFNSPDNKNTLVIEEWSWLLGGGAHCYLKENEFFLKRLDGYISTDDGYRAFSNNSYKIKWKDNKTCIIEYNNGQSGSDSVVINIDK